MSDIGNITGGFLNDASVARQIGPKAVLFQLGIMSAISLATLLAFEILRPANKVRYFVFVRTKDLSLS